MSIPVDISEDSQTMASMEGQWNEQGVLNKHWEGADGKPDGGISNGIGFVISWQRGSLEAGRNGAFLLEVLSACQSQLEYYQAGQFASTENQLALDNLKVCIAHLERRLDRRKAEGVLGTHEPDAVQPAVGNTEPFYVSNIVKPAMAMEITAPGVAILPTETTPSCGLGPK